MNKIEVRDKCIWFIDLKTEIQVNTYMLPNSLIITLAATVNATLNIRNISIAVS